MRALIVDDERLARQELRRLLEGHPWIEIIGEAGNIDEAEASIRTLQPALLFLDIRMPGGSGFDLLEKLDSLPYVIFTTAYDEFAVKAFESNALDYLLKPIDPVRLKSALERAAARNMQGTPRECLGEDDRVFVRDGPRCWLVRMGDVRLLESEGNYTRLCFGDSSPLVRRTLKSLDEALDPKVFFRMNRRQIVNLKKVVHVESARHGGIVALIEGGSRIRLSRRRALRFQELLGL